MERHPETRFPCLGPNSQYQGNPFLYINSWAICISSVLVVLAFINMGCSRHDAEGLALDRLLSSNQIDRIEVAAELDDNSGDVKTNVLTGTGVAALLSRLGATNRIANPVRHKSYISGYIFFFERDARIGGLGYFPVEQVLSFGKYEFSLRDTNDLRPIFR